MASPLDEMDFSTLFGSNPAPEPDSDPFGRIGAGDPAWEAARGAWMNGAPLNSLFGERLFDLNGTVGTGQANQRGDVFKTQALLHREGVLDAEATGGPTGYWGNRDDAALRRLQKENGLTVDGWAGPGGETMGWLRDIYRPPQGLQVQSGPVSEAKAESQTGPESGSPPPAADRDAIRMSNHALATTLGLDPETMELDSLETMRGLGAVRFYHHLDKRGQYAAMADIEKLGRSNPALAGKLRAKIADSIANPVWEVPTMTPQRLTQSKRETEQTLQIMRTIEGITDGGRDAWRYGKPKGAPKVIGLGMRVFDYGIGAARKGFEDLLERLNAEEQRRSSGP